MRPPRSLRDRFPQPPGPAPPDRARAELTEHLAALVVLKHRQRRQRRRQPPAGDSAGPSSGPALPTA